MPHFPGEGKHGAGKTEIGWETTKKDLVTERAGEIKEFRGLSGREIMERLKKAGEWDEFRGRFGEAAKILEENPDAKFDMTTSGKVNLDQQRTVFSALNSFTRGDLYKGRVSDFYVRMDLDRDGRKELYRLDGRYTLDRGIMDFEGDVYRVTTDGNEVKINPRGGIARIEGLQVAGITHGKAEAEDAFNVPTAKLSIFSVGADGRMSPEGVREILKTFSMATDDSLDPETRKAAMARGEFYLHLLENDDALRAGFVRSMTDLVHTYIRETHDVDVANKIAAGVQYELRTDTKDHFAGKLVSWLSSWSANIRGWVRDDFSKTAKESTTVQKFAGAVEGILTEANQVLSDEQQMKVLGNIYETAVGRAIHTVREKVGEYETDRSPVRAFTGSLPGPDVGRTGERLFHDYFDNPYTTEDVENFAKHKFATSGLVKPEDVFPELRKDEKEEKE